MQLTGQGWLGRAAVAAVAAVLGVAVGLALVGFDVLPRRERVEPTPVSAPSAEAACDDGRVTLQVAAAPEVAPAINEIVDSGPIVEGLRCVDVAVRGVAPVSVRAALGRGWTENTDGPPPNVWIPTTSAELELARSKTTEQLLAAEPTSVARSPSVIAMPQPMADALGWPGGDLSWNDIAKLSIADDVWAERDRPDWGQFRLSLVKDLASSSSVGAVSALSRAVGALPDADQTDTSDEQQFQARARLLLLERRVDYLGASTAEQLDELRASDADDELLTSVSALPLTEQMVWQYNGERGENAADTPLAAWYPTDGSPDADYPYVTLEAPWATQQTDMAAVALLEALDSPDGNERLRAHGFRDSTREATPELIEASGLRPDRAPPEPDGLPQSALRPLVTAWRGLSQTGNLLAVIDVSGSMKTVVPGTGATRLQLSAQGLEAGIALTDPASSGGLWEFSTNLDGDADHRALVPIGPLAEELEPGVTRQEAEIGAIRRLEPETDTGLYDTIAASYSYMLDNYEPGKLNAVIFFTDGKNDDEDGITLDQLQQRLRNLVDPDKEVRPEDIRNVFIDVQTGGIS